VTRGEFAEAVYTYCATLGASETSGQRTSHHNLAVGGVAHSAHLVKLASDVVYDVTPSREQRLDWGRRLGLLVVIEEDHDHLQPIDWPRG